MSPAPVPDACPGTNPAPRQDCSPPHNCARSLDRSFRMTNPDHARPTPRPRGPLSHPPRTIAPMPIELVTTPYGRPAAQQLRDAVARHKHDDPLRPVSVVVPTNYVGVAARRMLADGTLGPVTAHGP